MFSFLLGRGNKKGICVFVMRGGGGGATVGVMVIVVFFSVVGKQK